MTSTPTAERDVVERLRARAESCRVTGNHLMADEFDSYAREMRRLRSIVKYQRRPRDPNLQVMYPEDNIAEPDTLCEHECPRRKCELCDLSEANDRLRAELEQARAALQDLLLCPAILDEMNGDRETNEAVAKARAALRPSDRANPAGRHVSVIDG